MNCIEKVSSFNGAFRFLSNFHPAEVLIDNKLWPTTEHYYQAMKTTDLTDIEHIRQLPTPGKAKLAGKVVKMRSDWDEIKEVVMEKAVTAKFKQHPILMKRLLATGDALIVEGNRWHDNIWGNCYCKKCKNIIGQNLLGRIITKIRKDNNE